MFLCVARHFPQGFKDKLPDNLCPDKVYRAVGGLFAVGRTDIIVARGLVVFVAVAPVVIHLRAASPAIHQPGKRVCLAVSVAAPDSPFQSLCVIPCHFVDDGLMGVFKDFPFFLRRGAAVFLPKAALVGLEVDRMPHILNAVEDIGYCRSPPAVGVGENAVFVVAHAFPRQICRRA